ncbi:ATP-binding protein [Candidatus Poriferisodalis sp.]|uniref:ATP-binding protein n=1 Tax=Candidatus Poriferisodalis sp. TaxID=3101277 RepID=UPI003B016FA8
MAGGIESDLVERKESPSDAEKIRRCICAFANDLPAHGKPGIIAIGVTDDGRGAGLQVNDELLKRLADMRSDGLTLPIPSMDVQRHFFDGCDIAVVSVQPATDPPVRYKGRVWVRIGPTVRLASPADERLLAERRRSADIEFDLREAAEASISDLDLNYIERQYLPSAIAPDVIEENDRPIEEQMRSLRLLRRDSPTNGALLAFGRDPRLWFPSAYVQFVRYEGAEIFDPIKSQSVLAGQLTDVLGGLSQLIELNVETRLDITSGRREQRFPDYPIEALRQLAYNAVMHRSYDPDAGSAPIRLSWYSDRVEVQSPGGLFGGMTTDALGEGPTSYRNQLVAEIMHNLGFAQRFGFGIPFARRSLRENGNPEAKFEVEHHRVLVTVRPAR